MMRYTPARNDLFDSFFDDMLPTYNTATVMRTDIREKDGNYLLDIDLPGYKKEDIKISLYNGNLTIQSIRESDIRAGYENGILTLQIPTEQKKEAEEKKYIDIL